MLGTVVTLIRCSELCELFLLGSIGVEGELAELLAELEEFCISELLRTLPDCESGGDEGEFDTGGVA